MVSEVFLADGPVGLPDCVWTRSSKAPDMRDHIRQYPSMKNNREITTQGALSNVGFISPALVTLSGASVSCANISVVSYSKNESILGLCGRR